MGSQKKLLTVFGATGNQGGSVVQTFLTHPALSKQYTLRGVTRDLSKPNAVKLKESGVEMVVGDLSDITSLRNAVRGSYAVFAVTNMVEHFSKEMEIQQGRNMADAAKLEGVQHYIWSTVPHVGKLSNGKFTKVILFDSKAEVADYIQALGIPYTLFHAGTYYNNLERFSKTDQGALSISLPNPASTMVPFLDAARDTGKFVAGILTHPEKTLGKDIYGATGYYSYNEVVKAVQAKGPERKVQYVEQNEETFRGVMGAFLPPYMVDAYVEMFGWIAEFAYFGGEKPEEHLMWGLEALGLNSDKELRLTTLEEYVSLSEVL